MGKYRGESLTYLAWGGSYGRAQRQAYFLPFQEKFRITINEYIPRAGITPRPTPTPYHFTEPGGEYIHQHGNKGDIEELNPAIHNGYILGFPEVARNSWSGGGGIVYSTGLAYNLGAIDDLWDGQKPSSWADFWNIDRFPGNRSLDLRSGGDEALFFAQFALNPDILATPESRQAYASLGEEQIDQSFAKLEEISTDIDIWQNTVDECPKMLISGELDICATWNHRIWNAQQEVVGESIHYCYECGHIIQTSVFTIPQGIYDKELAELFIA